MDKKIEEDKVGKTGFKHTEESKRLMSESQSGANSVNYGRPPWHTNAAKKVEHAMYFWSMLDQVYDWYIDATKEMHENNRKKGNGSCSAAKEHDYDHTASWKSMIRWIRKNGDPRLNESWVEFKKTYKK